MNTCFPKVTQPIQYEGPKSCSPLAYKWYHLKQVVGGMDVFARGLIVADKLMEEKAISSFVEERYSSWNSPVGQEIMSEKATLCSLEKWVLENGEPTLQRGRQEMLENILNDYILG
ncbi:MAG: hypothetical protein WCH43_00050 [Verrucomicrobiota bacterium]